MAQEAAGVDVAAADGGGVGDEPTGFDVPKIPANLGFIMLLYGKYGKFVVIDLEKGKGKGKGKITSGMKWR